MKKPLVLVDRSVKINAEVYQEKIVRDVLLPWVAENFASGPLASGRRTSRHLSPDLNPMDFAVWGYLQQKVSSKSHQGLNALKASLQNAWDDIDVTFLRPTVMSVEKRLKACIAAKGAFFEHLFG
ncbi:unnamed protein product [Heligmosomoides polygyrus]|uniref:DDE-1 domain-containing protein n=1 Tax=Heligmosomoides polygyrus TaxID=6339 RepID=A0A183FLJ2_HELPZ|nr:unnamed protein product [Heligmosomoides polygyrus]